MREAVKAPLPTLHALKRGDKRTLARALAGIEIAAGSAELAALLDAACRAARAHVVGLTGPPGVGKSTLTDALVRSWRGQGLTVGVIAVDPSSQRSGGALLGDRARITTDPEDQGVFVRSMAARDRLGGLSDQTVAAMVLMRAVYDRVLVETVGIGQSEADIAGVADTVVLCIQPGSGDSLQFMKAGIMELPDIVVVTKADMGDAARRAAAEVEGALSLVADGRPHAPVVLVSAARREGLEGLVEAIAAHGAGLAGQALARRRATQEAGWMADAVRQRFGTAGLAAVAREEAEGGPFTQSRARMLKLAARLGL
jgi:LAO/AO transport system kinase